MDSLYQLINKITNLPEIYIGKPSLERLYAFIGGYLHQNEAANDHCLDGFNEYIARKLGISSAHIWASIIQFFSNNESEAFEKFIELFDEFQCRKAVP